MIKYDSEFKNGKPNGYGTAIVSDDQYTVRYEGNFKDGIPKGKGKYLIKQGSAVNTYEGDITLTEKKIKGEFKMPDGDTKEVEMDIDKIKYVKYFLYGERYSIIQE